jgi:hypothetical protein
MTSFICASFFKICSRKYFQNHKTYAQYFKLADVFLFINIGTDIPKKMPFFVHSDVIASFFITMNHKNYDIFVFFIHYHKDCEPTFYTHEKSTQVISHAASIKLYYC